MHGGQKHAPDSGQTYAQGAETCPRFRADLCTGGRNVPQIQGRLMHREQKRAPDSGQTYAQGAETCLRFRADFPEVGIPCLRFRADLCPVCIDVPEIQG